MSLTQTQAAATGLLAAPIGAGVGSFLWWNLVKDDCSFGSIEQDCVTTAQGVAYSWMALAAQNVSIIFGFGLAIVVFAVMEMLVWTQNRKPAQNI